MNRRSIIAALFSSPLLLQAQSRYESQDHLPKKLVIDLTDVWKVVVKNGDHEASISPNEIILGLDERLIQPPSS